MTGGAGPIGEDDLQSFVDRRLDGARLARVEAYLAEHPDIVERLEADSRHRDALRALLHGKFAEPLPTRLRTAHLVSERRRRTASMLRAAAAAVVIFAAGAGAGWISGRPRSYAAASSSPAAASVSRDANAAYRTYVVESAHPVEVDASPQGHLLQWLSKRLQRPLTAPDLSPFGYRLMGGRLLPAGRGAAAQLMYVDPGGKRLTVYLQSSHGSETAFRFGKDGEASTFTWIDHGFGFAVTAAEDRDRLLPIAEAVYRGFAATVPAGSNRDG